jgi:hypothetical protein
LGQTYEDDEQIGWHLALADRTRRISIHQIQINHLDEPSVERKDVVLLVTQLIGV